MNSILLILTFCLVEGYLNNGLLSISITRHHKGDIFIAQGEKCYKDFCASLSGGTATPTGNGECECKCIPSTPVFRDDLSICVDDIQECSLLPFGSNSIIKKIPYVFLPLKGQIVHPSADILISDVENPVCVVSGGQFLGQNGWLNLRNDSGAETPFRLFRDEGRTYLQWLGESLLRMAMEGRVILVHLMCKNAKITEEPKIFTPCIAFRVAGNPSVKEMMFITDVHLQEEHKSGLSTREYIAIGACSLLLAIVYVTAVFLCLHIRKRQRKKGNKKTGENHQLTLGEEGIIKSNPLLQAAKQLPTGGQSNAGYISESNSCCSDSDRFSDFLCLDDEDLMEHQNMQTSAIIHPCDLDYGESAISQDSNNIEKLPEENVSIIETSEVKDDHLETIKAMGCANGRRKLYFNPSYFEPDLLKAPPPAAVEFLIKIREVIAIAKHKISAKKFSPSLLGIPEEDGSSKADYNSVVSTQKDFTEIKRYGSKKSFRADKMPRSNFLLSNELIWPLDTKQKIIRKWLEDVPVMILQTDEIKCQKVGSSEGKVLNKSKLWQINGKNIVKENVTIPTQPARPEKRKTKGKAPPVPPLKTESKQESNIERKDSFKSVISENTNFDNVAPPSPPPMPPLKYSIDEIPRVQGKDYVPPAIAKNLMDAVIQELTNYKKNDKNSKLQEFPGSVNDIVKENVADTIQHFFEKELETVQTIQKGTTQTNRKQTDVKKAVEESEHDEHEYEIILLNGDSPLHEEKELKIYNLPEILSKTMSNLSKNDRTEGYSLVSEVYVNDGYSCCSGESSPSSYSHMSVENDKVVHYDTPNEIPGMLTIHVNDSQERCKTSTSESDNFEPDTLDRKPRRSKSVKKINEEREKYSNQKFQDMECYISSNKSENFADSLERSTIMLKTNGTFKQESLEKDVGSFFKTLNWTKVDNVGSLREIYEAKSRHHRKKTETTSLITMDTTRSDHDRFSTLSWSEERRNKLLHRGIILHINEGYSRKYKRTAKYKSRINPPDMPSRSLKPCPSPRSRSISPSVRSNYTSSSSCLPISPRSMSPPLPPPRSLPASPPASVTLSPIARSERSPPPQIQLRSTNNSPVQINDRGCVSPSSHIPNNSISKNLKNPNTQPCCPSPTTTQSISLSSFPSTTPPPRPPKTKNDSPVLPPRNTKPPLPPKNSKRYRKPGKFAGRPLPPLPRCNKDCPSSLPASYRDLETLSTFSGASMDSLNSSDYEAFYTLPYEEEEEEEEEVAVENSSKENFTKLLKHTISNVSSTFNSVRSTGNRRLQDMEKWSSRNSKKVLPPFRPEDSGYLSTDSDSCCPQFVIPSHFSKIPENGSQNSETEESLCDGESESGGESIGTDSFFYGNFKKKLGKISESGGKTEMYPYSLRLSDVELNSDTERHCVPIMVRP